MLKLDVNFPTFKVNSPPNTNLSSKIGDNESLPNFKFEHKSKTDFNRSHSSSKSSLRSSSNFWTSSFACGTFLSVIKKIKKIEQAKLLALQAKEHSKGIIKLLEKSVELGRESLLFEAAETRDKTELGELQTSDNAKVFPSSSRTLSSL